MPTISVIIPTFNRAHTLSRALDSVLNQTQPANEVIIIDDGSTDNTEALIQSNYASLCYLKQKNTGVSAARNHGINHSRSEWIALLDSDDEWLPNKLEKQLLLLQQHADAKIIHSDEIWIRNGTCVNQMKKHSKSGGWIFQQCLPLCAISPSAALIHRDIFNDVGLFDETLPACEDYDLWLRITACYPVLYSEDRLIKKYGGHDDQLSQQHWGMDRFRIQALNKCLNKQTLNKDNHEAARKMMLKKLNIMIKGAQKHNNQNLLSEYIPLRDHWLSITETQQ